MVLKAFHLEKDFPLSGMVEVRYDDAEKRCVYDPVSIDRRVTVPKVVRDDTRYRRGKDHE